jgi:ABC-type lipoprotein release transport system permease subunit
MSIFLGILIGSIVGLFLSLLMLQIPLAFLGVTTEIVWSRLPVFIALPMPLLASIILLSFVSAFATTYIVTRKSLNSNLADDFRHNE